MATAFVCAVCLEEKSEDHPHYAGEHPVCIECVRELLVPQFEQALKFEHFYPVKFGDVVLDVWNFRDALTPGFILAFDAREKEYKTMVSDRLYCPHHIVSRGEDEDVLNVLDVVLTPSTRTEKCNAFVGSKEAADFIYCVECAGAVCTRCEAPVIGSDAASDHLTCQAPLQEDDGANFDGLEKGVAWQQCPHCEIIVELKEACNEMACVCGRKFCFRCGIALPADGPGDHFARNCPRWGPVATARVADYDLILPPPPAPTAAQDEEARLVSLWSEVVGRTPRTYERILIAVMNRDLLRSTAVELQLAWMGQAVEDESTWRFHTAALLSRFAHIVDLILEATSAAFDALAALAVDFTVTMEEIGDVLFVPPHEFVLEHRRIERIVGQLWVERQATYFYLRGFPDAGVILMDAGDAETVDFEGEAEVDMVDAETVDLDGETEVDMEDAETVDLDGETEVGSEAGEDA